MPRLLGQVLFEEVLYALQGNKDRRVSVQEVFDNSKFRHIKTVTEPKD